MNAARRSMFHIAFGLALSVPLTSESQTAAPANPARPDKPAESPSSEASATADRLQGRLFFSPEQRERMDDARKRGLVPSENGLATEPQGSVVNGFVKRSDGNTAVWVDGVPLWNTRSKSADNLVPGDVGGPAAYLKATSTDAVSTARKPGKASKKTIKPRARKVSKPRLLP